MNTRNKILALGLAIGTAAAVSQPLSAATYNLQARPLDYAPADGSAVVPMWGYVLCTDNTFTSCPATGWSPGPVLVVPDGDTALTVNLNNALPAGVETSIMIDGIRSTAVIANGGGALGALSAQATPQGSTTTYAFTGVRPGAYVYKSGTDPRAQVQMGLYGAVRADYPAGVYSSQADVLLYSEIDPAMHKLVENDPPNNGKPTTKVNLRNYQPRYFLINGLPNAGNTVAPVVTVNTVDTSGATPIERPALIHLVNAGITERAPQLLGADFNVVAEDGHATAAGRKRTQSSTLLPPGKGMDISVATLTPGSSYALMDRRLGTFNGNTSGIGMLARINATGAAAPPVTQPDSFSMWDDETLSVPAPGVLANDLPLGLTAALSGALDANLTAFNANGSFNFTPTAPTNGVRNYSYTASNGSGTSAPQTLSINIRHRNHPPVVGTAVDQFIYGQPSGAQSFAVPGALAGDTDPDPGETATLTAVNLSAAPVVIHGNATTMPSSAVTLASSGAVTFTPPTTFVGDAEYTYYAQDINGAQSATPGTIQVVRDVRVSSATRNNNNRLSISGTIRGYGNVDQTPSITLQFTMAQAVGTNAANCTTSIGAVLGTIQAATADTSALGSSVNWSFTGGSGNGSPTFNSACNRFNVIVTNIPATVIPAGGTGTAVPAHAVTLANVVRTN